jgi:hypothetical protein
MRSDGQGNLTGELTVTRALSPEVTNDITRLISALESGNFQKGVGRFKSTDNPTAFDEFCCLGVYCEINGIQYKPSQGVFHPDVLPHRPPFLFVDDAASLPDDHWLFTILDSEDIYELQSLLIRLNDLNETYAEVITALRDFLNGKREFS